MQSDWSTRWHANESANAIKFYNLAVFYKETDILEISTSITKSPNLSYILILVWFLDLKKTLNVATTLAIVGDRYATHLDK